MSTDPADPGPPAAPARRRSLRTTVAAAIALLAAVVSGTALGQFLLARAVHRDVQQLFEELREVAVVRTLVDELSGISQWIESAPTATPASQPLVFADVRRHHAAALATLQRFAVPDDPSRASHDASEDGLVAALGSGLQELAGAIDRGSTLGELAPALAGVRHTAASLAATIENESRQIGDRLDLRSDEMAQFLLLLGVVSVATVGGLGWLLLRRVLRPVRALQRAAVRLGQGDLDAPIPDPGGDELGDFAQAFRAMAGRLRQSRSELEERVEQRSREVLRSARLAELGTLAAGIAHEINNPLASIVAGAEGLLRELDRGSGLGEGTRDYLQILRKEALRARDITTRLLRFARHDSPQQQEVRLAAEAHEVGALFAHQLQDAGVQLAIGEAPGTPPMLGDSAAWRQVLFNLLRNALDASPRQGTIRVQVASEDGEVVLTVADDGPGVPAALQERIFEPFFTTKQPGQGTGLGLAIVHRIVEAQGGRIRLVPSPRGACFRISVPAAGWPTQRDA